MMKLFDEDGDLLYGRHTNQQAHVFGWFDGEGLEPDDETQVALNELWHCPICGNVLNDDGGCIACDRTFTPLELK